MIEHTTRTTEERLDEVRAAYEQLYDRFDEVRSMLKDSVSLDSFELALVEVALERLQASQPDSDGYVSGFPPDACQPKWIEPLLDKIRRKNQDLSS